MSEQQAPITHQTMRHWVIGYNVFQSEPTREDAANLTPEQRKEAAELAARMEKQYAVFAANHTGNYITILAAAQVGGGISAPIPGVVPGTKLEHLGDISLMVPESGRRRWALQYTIGHDRTQYRLRITYEAGVGLVEAVESLVD